MGPLAPSATTCTTAHQYNHHQQYQSQELTYLGLDLPGNVSIDLLLPSSWDQDVTWSH